MPDFLAELRRKEQMLAEAQRLARIGSWEWDVVTGRVSWSDEMFRIYGMEPQSVEPSYEGFLELVHPDDRESVDARNRKAFADHLPFEDVKRVMRTDGSEFLLRTQGEVICDDDGAPIRMVGVCEDVTDRIRATEARELLASVIESSTDAIYTLKPDGTIASWNPAAERLFGYAAGEIVGTTSLRLLEAEQYEETSRLMQAALSGAAVDPWETVRLRRDGSNIDVSVSLSPVHDAEGRVTAVAVIARDVTERRRFEAQLRHLADHDALTGLSNRRRFEQDLRRAVESSRRYGGGGAVLILDLDNFKYVNDTLGHGAGDELLRGIAGLLRTRLRGTDVVARLGGDEFAVILPHAGAEEARHLARDLVTAVRRHTVMLDGKRVRATTSAGAALFDAGTIDAEEVIARADAAMYDAKDAGRDRSTLFEHGDGRRVRARAGSSWEARILEALDNDSFILHCQPILDLATDEITRYELLLRMNGHGDEVTPPSAFLPAAERLGLIHEIDRWVTREAIHLVAEHDDIDFEVNLSGSSLGDPELLESISRELILTGADPSRLIFEITETATIANMDDARRFAEALAAMGCRFAIDDFGAGFGSFTYLKHLPAAYLKIDGDFVRAPRSRTDELVIESIVGMARGLGKRTIAEFVGDAETMAMLTRMGVDFAQGDHVGRPFPVGALSR
jgi:diguanylate cyclase (GGDEF)-like protein/PAS domain S-box-containing protein